MNRLAILLAAVVAALAGAADVRAATFYVSPHGRDNASGRSAAHAWQTIARVNRAHLEPGDVVLFRGGAVFTDDTLVPGASGSRGKPIRFSSYGGGRAVINHASGAVWFTGRDFLEFDHLALTTGNADGVIFAGSSSGSSYITVRDCLLFDANYAAVNSPSTDDSHWTITGNTIRHVGDSGIILLGANDSILHNSIEDVGWNPALDYGKHGVYAKGPHVVVAHNRISHFPGSGVSLRYRGARVLDNVISFGPTGVSFFREDDQVGQSSIVGNRFAGITRAAFYYDVGGGENFLVSQNTISMRGGTVFDIEGRPAARIALTANSVSGSYQYALQARPFGNGAAFVEARNTFFGGAVFAWDGHALSFRDYRNASGNGIEDRVVATSH